MAAPVRLEASVWSDPRYVVLANLCGLAQPKFAIILCASIWSYCTERNEDVLSMIVVDALAGIPGFAEHMCTAELAEKQRKGYRIRGARGRIEWLASKKAAGSKGGSARSSNRQAHLKHTSSTPQALLEQEVVDPPSTPTPSYSYSSSCSSSEERETRAPEHAEDPEPSADLPLEHHARVGFEQRYLAARGGPPNQRQLGECVTALCAWVRGAAPVRELPERDLLDRALEAFFASTKARGAQLRPSYLATDPGEYVDGLADAQAPSARRPTDRQDPPKPPSHREYRPEEA